MTRDTVEFDEIEEANRRLMGGRSMGTHGARRVESSGILGHGGPPEVLPN